jgi:hypothetical protein
MICVNCKQRCTRRRRYITRISKLPLREMSIPIIIYYSKPWVKLLKDTYDDSPAKSVCQEGCIKNINDKCITSQCSKFKQVKLFSEINKPIHHNTTNYKILINMFSVFAEWESFIAFNGKLMETYCKNCIPYRDDPKIQSLPANTSFASITSTIGDVGISLILLKIYDLMHKIGIADYTLIVMVFVGLYQEICLENYGSYINNYSMHYPILSPDNPGFFKSGETSDEYVIYSYIPNYLWILLSFDLFNLKESNAVNDIDANNQKSYTEYMDIINSNIDNEITKSCDNTNTYLDLLDINLSKFIRQLFKLLRTLNYLEQYNNKNFQHFLTNNISDGNNNIIRNIPELQAKLLPIFQLTHKSTIDLSSINLSRDTIQPKIELPTDQDIIQYKQNVLNSTQCNKLTN